jgi:hypothetical protein
VVTVTVLAGIVASGLLFALADVAYPDDAASALIFYGGVLLTSVVVFILVRRATCSRRWWIVALLGCPATLILLSLALINLSMRFGSVSPSWGDSIPASVPSGKYDVSYDAGTNDSGSSYQLQNKTVWVHIWDASRGYHQPRSDAFLDDRLDLRCCHIIGDARWSGNERVVVTLSQKGIERTGSDAQHNDPYSVALARYGSREMLRLTYDFDSSTGMFKRTRLEVLDPEVMRSSDN